MNLQDQVIYRCIHAACARQLPRKVNFCPWCGTGQHDAVDNPYHDAPAAAPVSAVPVTAVPVPTGPAVAAAAPVAPVAGAAATAYRFGSTPEHAGAEPVPYASLPSSVSQSAPIAKAPPAPPAPKLPPVPPPAPAKAQGAGAASPPRREPVKLRWWLVTLAALWLIWIYARPDAAKKIESRIESATTASAECRLNDAQSELIALRMTKATPEQLSRLQKSIDAASTSCGKKKLREKSWGDTITAVENALAEGDFSKAQARLTQFTRRWNEDDETRKLKTRINVRREAAPPLAPLPLPEVIERSRPAPVERQAGTSSSLSARNLIDEAERALRAGNYRAAVDKLETCVTMVDVGSRECAAFKVHADRMLRDRERCTATGRVWAEDRCI